MTHKEAWEKYKHEITMSDGNYPDLVRYLSQHSIVNVAEADITAYRIWSVSGLKGDNDDSSYL